MKVWWLAPLMLSVASGFDKEGLVAKTGIADVAGTRRFLFATEPTPDPTPNPTPNATVCVSKSSPPGCTYLTPNCTDEYLASLVTLRCSARYCNCLCVTRSFPLNPISTCNTQAEVEAIVADLGADLSTTLGVPPMTYDQVCDAFEAGQLSVAGLTTCKDIEGLIKQEDKVPAGMCFPPGFGTEEAICVEHNATRR